MRADASKSLVLLLHLKQFQVRKIKILINVSSLKQFHVRGIAGPFDAVPFSPTTDCRISLYSPFDKVSL